MGSNGRKPPNPQGVPKQWGKRPSAPPPHKSGSGPARPVNRDQCCPMAAAVVSVKRGKFRLARRYAVMSVRLMVARLA